MMQLNKEKAELLNNAIDEWQSQHLLSDEQAKQIKQTIIIRKFNWKQITVYAFIIAVVCSVLSVIVLLADKPLRELIEKFTQITDFGISCILTTSTVLLFYFTKIRFLRHPKTPFSNQSFLLFGAFLSLATVSYWAKTLHVFHNHYVFIFLIATMMYVALAIYFRSQTIWVLSIIMFAFSYGLFAVSFAEKVNEMMFLGMNFPLRYLPFSLLVLSFS